MTGIFYFRVSSRYSIRFQHIDQIGKSSVVFSIVTWCLFLFIFLFLFSNLAVFVGIKTFTIWSLIIFSSAISVCNTTPLLSYLQSIRSKSFLSSFLEVEGVISEVLSILICYTFTDLQMRASHRNLFTEFSSYVLRVLGISVGMGIAGGLVVAIIIQLSQLHQKSHQSAYHDQLKCESENEQEEEQYFEDDDGEVMHISPLSSSSPSSSSSSSSGNQNFAILTMFLLLPIASYMMTEGLHASGLIAIRVCGVLLSYYSQYYLNKSTYPSCDDFSLR